MKKILFVGGKHDYDREGRVTKRDLSHDYCVWYASLLKFRPELFTIDAYWFDKVLLERGHRAMNEDIMGYVERTRPDLVIFSFGGDEIKKSVLKRVTRDLGITTVYIAGDDGWRFDSNARFFGPHCTWVLTSFSRTVPKYKALGTPNVMAYAGWANTEVFHREPTPKDIDVSFVGTRTEERAKIVSALRAAGLHVETRGKYWPEGEIEEEDLAKFISRTKIALGLNGSSFYVGLRSIARLFLRRPALGSRWPFYIPDVHHFFRNWREWHQKKIPQIKGRIFEIPACGTLQITEFAEDLDLYYEPGKEILIYKDLDDLVAQVRYYLKHDEERERMAEAAYVRTMRDHTAERRLTHILSAIGILTDHA
jgi:spore maturation protein CgeB